MDWIQQTTIFIIVFFLGWAVVYWIGQKFNLKSRGIEIKPLVFIFRTKKINETLDFLAEKTGKAIPILTNISLVFSVGLMGFGIYLLIKNLFSFFFRVEEAFPIFPAIPLVTIRESLPYFLISVAVIIIIHEAAHGVVARHEKIVVKSAGALLIAIIPGGFVEPDEESFKKASIEKKLKVLASGSSANLVFALMMIVLLTAFFQPTGVLIASILEDGPAAKAGLQVGDVIVAVDGKPTLNVEKFREIMKNVGVDTTVVLDVKYENGSTKSLMVTTVSAPEDIHRAIIGVYPSNYVKITPVYLTLFWIQLWSISIAVFNMIPIYPLDGGNLIHNLLEKYTKNYAKTLSALVSSFFLSLLALNILLTFSILGFISI